MIDATAPLRWGVVGTGGISRQIASDFASVENAQVVGVSSRSSQAAESFGQEFDIRDRHVGVTALLASDIDAVYIGTPHVTHFDIAAQTIRAGKHVLCEKPLATNTAETAELAALAREARVFLMEAMWMKFTPLHRRLHEYIEAGALGELRTVQASFGAAFPRDDSSRWLPGGSALLDQGIYPVTLALSVLGAPDRIRAGGTVRTDGVDLRGHFVLEYSDDRIAQGAFSMVEWMDMGATVGGTEAWITLPDGFWFASELTLHRPLPRGQREDVVVEVVREGFGYVPMLRAVTAAIRDGLLEHPLHTAAMVGETFRVLDRIRQSFHEETPR